MFYVFASFRCRGRQPDGDLQNVNINVYTLAFFEEKVTDLLYRNLVEKLKQK
jgi:hypothetical protein